MYALGRLKSGQMNGTERSYANRLEAMKSLGEILWYSFEGMKFKLATKCFYTPDFMVLNKDGTLEAHEVKGYWQDDARVKIKTAAEKFPVKFIAVQYKKKEWLFEEF